VDFLRTTSNFYWPYRSGFADVADRKKTIMFTNLSQAIFVLLYALINRNSSFLIYGIAIIYSFFNQFYVPAEQATLPQIVGEKHFAAGNTLFFLTQQTAILIGFGVAGVLRNVLGFENTLLVCSFFLFAAFAAASFLPSFAPKRKLSESFEKEFIKFFQRILEGYYFIKGNRTVFGPLALLLLVQVALAIILVNIPVIAVELFRINVEDTGILLVPPTALGAGIAAIIVPKLLAKK
jgi:hypothetical protein